MIDAELLNINVIRVCTWRQSKITANVYVTLSFSKILILKILKILREYLFKYLNDNLEALQTSFFKYELYYSCILLKR